MDPKALGEMKPENMIAALQLLVQQNPQYAAAFQAQAQAAAAAAAAAAAQSANSSSANPTNLSTTAASSSTLSANPPTAVLPQYSVPALQTGGSKYTHLLMIIEEINKDIRPTYSGNRNCGERLKRGINHARVLVRECLLEINKMDKQNNSSSS